MTGVQQLHTGLTVRVIAVGSGKGGTGKSTVAAALAHTLQAEFGREIAAVDLDPQASLTLFLGHRPVESPLTADPVQAHGFVLYRGGVATAQAGDQELEELLERASSGGRLVIVDLRGTLDDNGHTAYLLDRPGTYLLLVPRAELRSVPEVRKLTAQAEARRVPFRIVANMTTRRVATTKAVSTLRQFYGPLMTAVEIPDLKEVSESELRRMPVTAYAPNSRIAEAVRGLAAELLEEIA